MKKRLSIVLFVLTIASVLLFLKPSSSSASEQEMRAAWVSTVFNIDWPSKGSQGNAARQKQEYINLLEKLKSAGINTVVIQVRPESDALYKSSINPWSRYLTGVQGKNPGYDPLQFVLDESHKRGIKVHAWFNPYRASIYEDISSTASNNAINTHRDWVVKHGNKWYYDPGIPAVRDYIVNTVSEVVRNYNIDGVHFDDYFYPAPDFNDGRSFAKYGSGNKDQWRRRNVNTMIDQVHRAVKSIKPNVDFGVSPAGIWRNRSNDSNGSNTSGGESYAKHYADTRYWIKNNLVDYVVPQVYWRIGHPKADYATLVKWWSDQVRGTGVKLYIGQGIYKHGQSEYGGENVASEIKQQINLNRRYSEIKGSIYFSARDIANIGQVYNDLKSLYGSYNGNSGSGSGNNTSPGTSSTGRLPYQNEMMGSDRAETAIQISKKSYPNGAQTAILVNGNDLVNAVVSSPLASQKNAPILLSYAGGVSLNTANEIKRLKVSELIVIGDGNSITQNDINTVKKVNSNINIDRINSSDPEKVSRIIFDKISETRVVDSVFVASKNALPDALSIASKAGVQKTPILISSNDSILDENIAAIRDNGISNIYFIGGPNVLSDNVIAQVGNAIGLDLSQYRIYGEDRIDTNTKVLEKFYGNKFSQKAFLTRSDAPIDAITVSAFAQKSDSPVILVGRTVSNYQRQVLSERVASLVYKVGGGINLNSYKTIYSLLGGDMK